MKQVLLFDTAIATTNLGDEIIFDSVKKGLSRILDESLSFRLGTHIENYSFLQLLGGRSWKYKKLCKEANYKFVCGTNLLCDNLIGRARQWMLFSYNARLYEDCVLVGVGKQTDYEQVSEKTQKLYRKVLSTEYAHSVRDEETKQILESMGYKAINTGCPTLWELTPEFCSRIPKEKADTAVITVSGYAGQQDYEQDAYMLTCVLENYNKVYAWIQTVDDKVYLDKLPGGNKIECIYSLEKFSRLLNAGNIDYIGTRLHGGVYALQHGIRSIVVSIDQRAEGFQRSNNLPIIQRNKLQEELYGRINSEWATQIKVNYDAINAFINQFV